MKHVCIISPVYNEQDNVEALTCSIIKTMQSLPYNYSVILIDDGSTDSTLAKIKKIACGNANVQYISLSRNFGHQSALKAGLDMASGDCVISMDADMQHPVDLIPVMLEKYEEGYEVVFTLRQEDKSLPAMKRRTSAFFYSLINRISDVKIEKGSADFRLLSIRVVEILRNLSEHDLFFRGLVKWVGFRQVAIEYSAANRMNGTTKFTFKKMLRFAIFGITAFSTKPLYIAAYLGLIFSLLSFLYLPYVLYSYFFGYVISGWASVIVTIAFFGGLQLMILGIIGIYMGRMFIQIKNRPVYIIKESNMQ
jgi:polyisoprenyl-phosphate glycosyltransferase